MSINCAAKYANIEANTARGDKPKTLENVSFSMGELSIAGATSAINIISMEKKEAKIPAMTT